MRTKSPAMATFLAAVPVGIMLALSSNGPGGSFLLDFPPVAFLGVSGLGHLYLGAHRRAAILIASSLVLVILMMVTFVQIVHTEMNILATHQEVAWNPQLLLVLLLFLAEAVLYLGIWIWQIIDVRKLTKKFNYEVTKTEGAEQ